MATAKAKATSNTKAKATPGTRAAPKAKAAPSTKAAPKARRVAAKPRSVTKTAKSNGRPLGAPKAAPTAAPRQGFEVGSEIEQGLAVGPPSSIELATSVVGLLGEAAQAGAVSGGRLLKGVFSRLPGR